jgi:hypothetical protein
MRLLIYTLSGWKIDRLFDQRAVCSRADFGEIGRKQILSDSDISPLPI